MATYEQLMRAARQAHEGGNAEHAKRLLQLADKAKAPASAPSSIEELPAYAREAYQQTMQGQRDGESDEDTFRRAYYKSDPDLVGLVDGIGRSALQGVSMGFGDEATAALASVMGPGSYDEYLARERADLDRFREESPVTATVSEVAGALPTAFAVPASAAFRGGSMAQKLASGALTGAGMGGAYGYGAGEGGVENRLENAGVSAGIGGAVGLAAVPAGSFASRLMQSRMTNRAANQAGMSRPAYDVLNRTMAADDSFTGPGAARIAAAGDDAMLADAGPNALTVLDTTVQRSGPGATIARNAIDERVGVASQRITRAMDDAFGQPVGIRSTERGLRQGTATARRDAYDVAYDALIDYASPGGQQLEAVMRGRVPHHAIKAANELMRTEGVPPSQQILVQMADDGTMTFSRLPDVRQLDYITRGLNEVAEVANGQGAAGGTTQVGRAYANLSREIRNLVRDQVPEYATALETAAEPIAARNALQLGAKALRSSTTRDELAEAVQGMTGPERSYVAAGIRSQIDEALSNVKRAMTDPNMDAREAAKALKELSSRAAREKVETVIGPRQAGALFRELDQAATAFEMRAGVAANSRTFARTSTDDMVRAQSRDGAMNALRRGEAPSALKRTVQAVTGRTEDDLARLDDQVYGELAQVLTGPRGPEALRYLQMLMQGQQAIPQQAAPYGRLTMELLRRNPAVTAPMLNQP